MFAPLRSLARGFFVGAGVFAVGCAPLPVAPSVAGPGGAPTVALSDASTRELVWYTARGVLRIKSTRMCQEDEESSSSGACVSLSSTDRRELDRFFGANTFRKRWDLYRPCAARYGDDNVAFGVTFADGHTVAKVLMASIGTPAVPDCDRAMRNTVTGIGTDLVTRYFQ